MRFTERTPKSPRELERFYLETKEKLKGTEATLEDVESLLWLLFSRSQQQDVAGEIEDIKDEMRLRFAFLPNHQQEIDNIMKTLDGIMLKFSFLPNHQQEIRDIQHDIDDNSTLHYMRI